MAPPLVANPIVRFLCAVCGVFTILTLYHSFLVRSRDEVSTTFGLDKSDESDDGIPRRIFQTWPKPAMQLVDPFPEWTGTWATKNPGHRYELITDDAALTYVKAKFKHEPLIVETFGRITDGVLRADYFRYLALFADGGVYTDMDTVCIKPIDEWLPANANTTAKFIVGVEFDSMGEDLKNRKDFTTPIQFCQWTMMAAPGQPVMRAIVDLVTANLQRLGRDKPFIKADTQLQVLYTTGPPVMTTSIMKYLSEEAGRPVSFSDLSGMWEPRQFGSMLIMNVNAFSSGASHSNATAQPNPQELARHHYNGRNTWRTTHNKDEGLI